MSTGLEIINPAAKVSGGEPGSGVSSKRIETPEGLRIGLLDNGMPHAGEFLNHIGESFEKRYRATLLMRRKSYTARSAGAELLDEIASKCDVVITGFGV
jgi:hypothetical protein